MKDLLVPQLPAGEGQTPVDAEIPEDAMERLTHLEQLVVQLKELIRDKDAQLLQKETELTNKDAQLKVSNIKVFILFVVVQTWSIFSSWLSLEREGRS